MDRDEALAILKKVQDVAALAGIRGRIDEARLHFEAGFNLPEGRSQMVYVRIGGKAVDGSPIVTCFSPCVMVSKGFFKGMSKTLAIDLLKRNEQVMFARYGIWSQESNDLIVASVDRLVDTLDHTDFAAMVWYVAFAADNLERQHGSDKF